MLKGQRCYPLVLYSSAVIPLARTHTHARASYIAFISLVTRRFGCRLLSNWPLASQKVRRALVQLQRAFTTAADMDPDCILCHQFLITPCSASGYTSGLPSEQEKTSPRLLRTVQSEHDILGKSLIAAYSLEPGCPSMCCGGPRVCRFPNQSLHELISHEFSPLWLKVY